MVVVVGLSRRYFSMLFITLSSCNSAEIEAQVWHALSKPFTGAYFGATLLSVAFQREERWCE
jgi:hypothetical protein